MIDHEEQPVRTVQSNTRETLPHVATGKRVLLVEDEALITTLVVDVLEDRGMVVIGPAATLRDALALAGSEQIDAAILDVNLGAETSFPVARLLRERGIPFFYTTAFANRTHPDIGDAAFLPKPYGIRQLLETLDGILAAAP